MKAFIIAVVFKPGYLIVIEMIQGATRGTRRNEAVSSKPVSIPALGRETRRKDAKTVLENLKVRDPLSIEALELRAFGN